MKIKLKNAKILSKDYEILDSSDLVVEENIIKTIRATDSSDDASFDRVINCDGNYLIPGFKNGHAHNGMTFVRSFTDDVPLDVWLNDKIFPMEAKMNEDDVHYFTILGVMECLQSGITSCADMYKMNRVLAETYYELKYRVNLVDSVTPFDKVIEPETLLNDLNNYKNASNDMLKYTLGLHAEYTNNKETFKLLSDLVHKYKVAFYIHISETEKEVKECKERWGGHTPAEVCEEYGLFDYGGGGYHGVYLSDQDVEIFKKHNLILVTNPASNLKLASGIAPIRKYLNAGLNIAIGTDGPASNNAIDMFREMYLVSNLSRYIEMNAVSIDVKEILNMVFVNGAKCIGTENCNSLSEGNFADIVMIDIHKPNMQPENIFINNLVYACGKQNVKLTMVNGNILYEDGKYFLPEKEEYIYKKCNELLEKLKNR